MYDHMADCLPLRDILTFYECLEQIISQINPILSIEQPYQQFPVKNECNNKSQTQKQNEDDPICQYRSGKASFTFDLPAKRKRKKDNPPDNRDAYKKQIPEYSCCGKSFILPWDYRFCLLCRWRGLNRCLRRYCAGAPRSCSLYRHGCRHRHGPCRRCWCRCRFRYNIW